MISTPERRQGDNARIPCAIPVELTPDSRGPGFEADAVDLSAGGLSLRASSLPEVGAMLNCRFETLPGGTRISGRGEVVWAKLDGERSGEFGLRFTEIEPEAQALLAEMIAERVAQGGAPAPQSPRTATLEIQHAEQPITAKLTRAVGQDVVFEQPLDVLALGSSVVAHADKALGHGNILRVDLRMDGGTPTLALTVRFSQPADGETYGEYDWGEAESAGDSVPAPAEEKAVGMPELAAALSPHTTTIGYPRPVAGVHGRTVAGYALPVPVSAPAEMLGEEARARAEERADSDSDEDDDEDDDDDRDEDEVRDSDSDSDEDTDEDSDSDEGDDEVAAAAAADQDQGPWTGDRDTEPDVLADIPRAPEQLGLLHVADAPRPSVPRPVPVMVRKPEDFPPPRNYEFRDDAASVEEYDAVMADGGEESAAGTYDRLELRTSRPSAPGDIWADEDADEDWSQRESGTPAWSQSTPDGVWAPGGSRPSWTSSSQSSLNSAAPNTALVRFLRIFAGLWETVQPPLDALKRSASRAQQVVLPGLRKRLVGSPIVKSTLRGVGQRPRRNVGLPTVEHIPRWSRGFGRLSLLAVLMLACGYLFVYALTPAAPSDEIVTHRPVQLEEETSENAATDPAATPLEAADESAQPIAQNGRNQMAGPNARPKQAPAAPQAELLATSFGAKQVPNGQRFLLRMSDPIKTLHGKADARGFIVQVPASRAIDRAAPIAAANKAVAKATILNKGTHAELNIRFAEGRSPAYRVSAQQAGLEVLIGQ